MRKMVTLSQGKGKMLTTSIKVFMAMKVFMKSILKSKYVRVILLLLKKGVKKCQMI
jgi:hypothetical protein